MSFNPSEYEVEECLAASSQHTTARSIKDPVHDFIPLSSFICAFIDTRQFQRLRYIKQLGTSYYVWPGASHNRFEHCIGVAYLAKLMVERLRSEQPELAITERDVRCVELAGLCHDLGHGPWSHVWDGHFIPEVLPGKSWSHEDASEMMFDDLILQNEINIPQDDINFVKDLIKGVPNHSRNKIPPEKGFLFEIVANKRNGIDVDKFDYIVRDTHAVGDHGVIPVKRLIESARVVNNEICYHIKDANTIYELCYTRFSNHKRIYNHKTAKAIEYMIVDALMLAEPTMKIAEQIMDPRRYVYLTDDIMLEIEKSEQPELAPARAIFDRIRTRDLYKLVDYQVIGWEYRKLLRDLVTPSRIVAAAKDLELTSGGSPTTPVDEDIIDTLTKEHVIVDIATMHYGMGEKNPMDFVRFYSKVNINQAAKAGRGDVSQLMPKCFGEVLLRIFTRDVRYFGIIQAGYRAVLRSLPDDLDDNPRPPTPPLTESEQPATPGRDSRRGSVTEHLSQLSSSHPKAGGSTGSRASPFWNNSFTQVPKNYVPPSPSQEHRRLRRESPDASGASRVSSFTLSDGTAGTGSGEGGEVVTPKAKAPPHSPFGKNDKLEVPKRELSQSPSQGHRRSSRRKAVDDGGSTAEGSNAAKRRKI
ncbi:HD-domain/PDEase-like protein [Rickenella mellea]|uniref:HD-domain/PDEase-like protein n=1 Tax=Rickenella mellea TaxID=50990 RepID=A0A4Y7PV28_9AGAM|nr:HD-domain/PDEase-like protein [Rickenella mellea]